MRAISYGNSYEIFDDSLKTYDKLPIQNFIVRFSQTKGFYLEKYSDIEIKENKIYGVHLEKIDKVFDKALADIQKYQTSDPDLYLSVKNRLMKERLSPTYIKLTILPSYYSDDEIAQMRAEFKYYVNLFKLSEVQEGAGFGDLLN